MVWNIWWWFIRVWKYILGIGSKVDMWNDYDGEDSDDCDNDSEIETDEEYEL